MQIAGFIDVCLNEYLDEYTYVVVANDFNYSAEHILNHDGSLVLADLNSTNDM